MDTFFFFCILAFLIFKTYRWICTQLQLHSTYPGARGHDHPYMHEIEQRMMSLSAVPHPCIPQSAEEAVRQELMSAGGETRTRVLRTDEAIAILSNARENLSDRYCRRLLSSTPSDRDREQFEYDWSRAKEAVRAKYGSQTLNSALIDLRLN